MPMKEISVILGIVMLSMWCGSANSQVWNREVADSSGNDLGYFSSLALDQSDNPVFVHMDLDFYDLRYLERIDGEWTVKVIDSTGYTGFSCDLELDDNQVPHICFEQGALIYDPTFNYGVNYLTRDQTDWSKVTIEEYAFYVPTLLHSFASIDLTSAGQPVIGYWSQARGYYYLSFKRNGEWEEKQSPYTNPAVKMRLMSDDTPVMFFLTDEGVMFVTYDENLDAWNEFPVPFQPYSTGFWKTELDFMLDQNDHLHCVCNTVENLTVSLSYLYFDWVSWQAETIASGMRISRIAIDQSGYPAILTIHDEQENLVLFRKDGVEMTYETIDPNCTGFLFADILFDSNDAPHIVVQAKPGDIISEKEKMVIYYNLVPGLPNIYYFPESMDFGEVWTESYRMLPVSIKNNGVAPLVIGGFELSNTNIIELQGPGLPAYINPGDSIHFTLKFSPVEEQVYTENLRFVTNDPERPVIDIPVTGSGVASGSSSTLEILVKDMYVDFDYMLIDHDDPLGEVLVGLYQDNTLVTGQQLTNNQGQTILTELSPGSYKVSLFKGYEAIGEDIDCSRSLTINLGPGYNSHSLTLADSLFHYQTWLSNILRQVKETDNELVPYLNYSEVMDHVNSQMNLWAGDFDPQLTESLARLVLVETMVYDLFEEGYNLGNEMFKDFGELISFVFYSNDWSTRILDFLIAIVESFFEGQGAQELFQELMQIFMEEIVKKEIYERVTEAVMLAGTEVGFPGDELLMEAWQRVWSEYASGWNLSFGTEQWGSVITGVTKILRVPFIQEVYIEELTAPKIQKGLDYASDNLYNGTFHDAFMREMNYVSSEKNTVGISLTTAQTLRVTADLFMRTAIILDWAGSLDIIPFADIIDQIGFYMKLAAYMEVTVALGVSTGKFFVVPSNMGSTVDKIYFPHGKPKKSGVQIPPKPAYKTAQADISHINQLKASIKADNSEYSAVLTGIKEKISTGDKLGAASDILLLREAELEHNNNILKAASPVMAVAYLAKDSIESFAAMYDSLKSYHALAGQERLLMYYRLLLAVADTTNDSDSLITDLIDQNLAADSIFTGQISDLLDTVSMNLEIPAVLIASVTSCETKSLAKNETGSVLIRVKNTGALPAENIYLNVSSSEAIAQEGNDSIYIGTLSPGQETDEIELIFRCMDDDYEFGLWNITIASDDARVLPCSGIFSIGETTSIENSPKPDGEYFSVYPNPLIQVGYVSYKLEQAARVRLSLYDLSGRKLSVLKESEQGPGTYRLPINLAAFGSGFYVLVLEKNGIISAKTKIVLSGKN